MNSNSALPIAMANIPCQTDGHAMPSTSSPYPVSPVTSAQPSQPPPAHGSAIGPTNVYSNHPHFPVTAGMPSQGIAPSFHSPENVLKFSRQEADQDARRYRGYPAMCKWAASDDDFFVLRRFGELSARILFRLQDRIVKIEEDLQRMDEEGRKYGSDNGTFRYDPNDARQWLLDELTLRLEQYQRFLLDHTKIKARSEATKLQISNVKNWFYNATDDAIQREEKEFINKDGDLIPVVPKIKTPLRRFIDKFKKPRLWAIFRDKYINERLHGDSDDFGLVTSVYSKESVIDKSVTFVTMVLGIVMIIGPLWLLQHLTGQEARLGVITGFLVVFTVLLSILTVARPFEVLAATAAYGAVLMVFMQISPSSS